MLKSKQKITKVVVNISVYLNRRVFVMNSFRLDDLKRKLDIFCTIMKYGETFYAATRHLTSAAMK